MRLYKRININDIVIPKHFAKTTPSKKKVDKYESVYERYKAFRNIPVIDKNNTLADGYIPYLLMKEKGFNEVVVLQDTSFSLCKNKVYTYIFGQHINTDNFAVDPEKEGNIYVWKVPRDLTWDYFRKKVKIGNVVICNTKNGKLPIIVTDIKESSEPPREGRIKTVAYRIIQKSMVDETMKNFS